MFSLISHLNNGVKLVIMSYKICLNLIVVTDRIVWAVIESEKESLNDNLTDV